MENNEESVITKIALDIITYKEDHSQYIITDSQIKSMLEEHMEELIEEVRKELRERQ